MDSATEKRFNKLEKLMVDGFHEVVEKLGSKIEKNTAGIKRLEKKVTENSVGIKRLESKFDIMKDSLIRHDVEIKELQLKL